MAKISKHYMLKTPDGQYIAYNPKRNQLYMVGEIDRASVIHVEVDARTSQIDRFKAKLSHELRYLREMRPEYTQVLNSCTVMEVVQYMERRIKVIALIDRVSSYTN